MTTPADFHAAEREILTRLDIPAELTALGVRFSSDTPSAEGWLPCFAIDRDEENPSAAVNIISQNGKLGRYKDLGGNHASRAYWDTCVVLDPSSFPTWQDARQHFADKVNVKLPGSGPSQSKSIEKDPFEKVSPIAPELSDALLSTWCAGKPPIKVEAVKAAGGIPYHWPSTAPGNRQFRCVGFTARIRGKTTGLLIYRTSGKLFPETPSGLPARKAHLCGGSRDGWVIVGGEDALAAATTVWAVEGIPDSLAIHPLLPAGHVVVTNVCGASARKKLPYDIFAGKAMVFVGDQDTSGLAGVADSAPLAAAHAGDVRIATLPYPIEKSSGKDLRDFFNDGGTFEKLAETIGEPVAPAASSPAREFELDSIGTTPQVGDTVQSHDRKNYGKITHCDHGNYSVAFVSPDGHTAIVQMSSDDFTVTKRSDAKSPRGEIEKFNFRDLRTKYPKLRDVVIEGVARRGETINIISVAKIGKSWLLYQLLLSVASGRAWLGLFPVLAGRVLLIDNELHANTLAYRIPESAAALSIQESEYAENFEIWPTRGKALDIFAIGKILDQTDPGRYLLISIDAKYRSMPADASENDNAAETAFFNEVDRIAAHTGAVIVLVHHSTKGGQSDKRVTDVGSGASAQSRAADSHLILREHEEADTVVLAAAVRSFKPVEPVALKWTFPIWIPDTDIDPEKLKGAKSPKEEQQNLNDRDTDTAILTACQTWRSRKELRIETGWYENRINRSIRRLLAANFLEKDEQTRRGQKCDVFRKTIYAN